MGQTQMKARMDSQTDAQTLRRLGSDLHDICQPLTTLQCRLELGLMHGDEPALREALEGSLLEMTRVFRCIATMREHLAEAVSRAENGGKS